MRLAIGWLLLQAGAILPLGSGTPFKLRPKATIAAEVIGGFALTVAGIRLRRTATRPAKPDRGPQQFHFRGMSWLKKKTDPISERARSLNSEIAALEAQIKRLDAQLHREASRPRVRSTALPHGATIPHAGSSVPTTATAVAPTAPAPPPTREPIFEDLDQRDLKTNAAPPVTPGHFNAMGVRKYDVAALAGRVKHYFRGTTPMNPRLISYLAAGGIQGLQPLRREKRVARNRFIALTAFLFLILLGIIFVFARNR